MIEFRNIMLQFDTFRDSNFLDQARKMVDIINKQLILDKIEGSPQLFIKDEMLEIFPEGES